MVADKIVYYERPLYNYAGERVGLEEIGSLLTTGPIYLFGLPWSGKTTVARALGQTDITEDTEALEWIKNNINVTVPAMIDGLFDKEIKHTVIVEKEEIKGEMLTFL